MRDPERIDAALAALGTYWKANPDLRLGQIVMNAFRVEWAERRTTPEYRAWLESDSGGDESVRRYDAMFNMEEDRLVRGLQILAAMG